MARPTAARRPPSPSSESPVSSSEDTDSADSIADALHAPSKRGRKSQTNARTSTSSNKKPKSASTSAASPATEDQDLSQAGNGSSEGEREEQPPASGQQDQDEEEDAVSDSADEAHEPSLGSNPSQAQNQVQASQQRQVPADADPSPLKPARLNSQAPKSPSPSKPRMRQISAFSDAKPSTTNTPAAPPKPRLTIHKIVLINFKSYAGVVNIGPFHASFSAIVGPNGSGKSNTIDALLFVFGFKASKMRQGKLSELIHNSDQFQDLDFCSVEVHFREIVDLDTPVPPGQPPPFEVVPGTELVVARTAYRNNTSKYTVNSRTSNYKDVTTLLKGKGIDLDHKRFLILQGEVESIALMKPKGATEHEDGLLEYLEDIIGTDRFKEPLEQANKDVEELNDQRTHAMNRVKLVEHEKALLEPRKKEAEGYLRDQNQLVIASSKLFQYNRWAVDQVISEGKHRLQSAEQHLEEERQKQADIRKDFEETQAAYNESAAEVKTVEEEAKELQKELAAFEKQDIQLQEQKKHFTTKFKKVKKAIQEDTHARSSANTTIKDKADEVQTYNKDIEKLEAQLEKEEKELDAVRESLKGKTSHLSEQIEAKQAELAPWKSKLSEARNKKNVVQNERDLMQQRIDSAQKNMDEAKSSLEQLEQQKSESHEALNTLREEESEAKTQAAELQRKLDGIKGRSDAARSKANSAKSKMDEARATQSANTSRSKVLTDLSKLRDQGRLDGFYGRLGDLGRIDDKYDVAISTAAPGLNNLVCDAVETGQRCLEQLRRTKSGRATIMCLDKMQNRNMAPIKTPENVPRLFDLVTAKDKMFAAAFYEVLKDTLVATDLTQANRIAFGAKRWRVVTLDGKLIDTSGTMAGGGSRVIRGLMGSRVSADEVRPEQMARLERDASEAEQDLRKIVEDQSALENELQGAQRRPGELRMQIQKVDMTLKSCGKRLQDCQQRIQDLSSRMTPEAEDLDRISQLDAALDESDKELAKLSKKTDPIEADIKRLQDEILAVGGTKLRVQQTKVSDIKERLDLLSDRLTKAEVARSKAEKDVVKLEKALETNKAAEEELEGSLDELEKKIARNNVGSENFRSQVEAVQATLEEAREGLTERKSELDVIGGQMKKFREKEAKLEQECTKIQDELAENDRKLNHWQHSLDQLRLHEVDDESDDEDEPAQAPASPAPKKEDDHQLNEEERAKTVEKPHAANELRDYSEDELEEMDPDQLKADKAVLEERVEKAKPNLEVLKEYRKREAEFLKRIKDSDAISEQRDQAKQTYDNLRKQRLEEFMDGFSQISLKLKEMYQMITMGGNAELELVDSLDPFSEGIVFSVMPPKKSWRNISNLSGGEKTLSSLALVFALHAFKPTPLYFMDEIDAALDFRNVSIVANYIAQRTKNAQFIIISLRNNMFELASRLVGIYKTANCTKSVTISNTNLATA